MSQIVVKFDPSIKQTEIVAPLNNSSVEESGSDYKDNQSEIQQSMVFGILSPLICINNIIIEFDAIREFSLKSSGPVPTLSMIVVDRFGLLSTLDNPGNDNEIRLQILPPFDNAYKKIDMTFYISNIRISGGKVITLTGLYKVPKLTSSNFKSLGKMTTYELVEYVANETSLGFASNISGSSDKRYIYCDNKSYQELLSREVMRGGAETQIYDWWVDFWNCINLADIYERYNTIDKDLKVWVSAQNGECREGSKIEPIQISASLNNHPADSNSELYVIRKELKNKLGSQLQSGTDHVYSIYREADKEYTDTLVQDGDVKKDIFVRHEYLGEVYGDWDYLLSEKKYIAFMQKINTESLEVVTRTPLLGLMRGHKVDFIWYINDSTFTDKLHGLVENEYIDNFSTQIPLEEHVESKDDTNNKFTIDKMISGQYLITSVDIRYSSNNGWEQIYTLNRPAKAKPKILKDE